MDRGMDDLNTDERIVFHTKEHWAILIGPFLLLIASGLLIPAKGLYALALFCFAALLILLLFVRYQRSALIITDRSLFIRTWFLRQSERRIPLTSLVNGSVQMPALGKLLDFGKVRIIRTGGRNILFRFLASPMLFLEHLHEEVTRVRNGEEQAG